MLPKRVLYVSLTAAALATVSTAAFAQSKFETPDGHQTIGPSQMQERPATAPGAATPGAMVAPPGESSTVRNGPMEPLNGWVRATLAVLILFQTAVLFICATALTWKHRSDEENNQGGQLINEDYREPRAAA